MVSLSHFNALMGPLGLYQHALLHTPRLEEGYCTDDNARAVQLLLELRATGALPAPAAAILDRSLDLCWKFIRDAQAPDGQFRNFRDVHGRWLDQRGSEETQARTLRALSSVIQHTAAGGERQVEAVARLQRLLPQVTTFVYARSIAEAAIGLSSLLMSVPPAREVLDWCVSYLLAAWEATSDADWPWFEHELTYANALLPHGLLAGATALGWLERPCIAAALAGSVQFLVQTTIVSDIFAPVGNSGWYGRDARKAPFDQQPIEAHTMLDFLLAYHAYAPLPTAAIAAPYTWFWGANTRGEILADRQRGAGCDGLNHDGVNPNCGAESTLAYLRAELLLQRAPHAVIQHVRRQMTHQSLRSAPAIAPT